MRVYSGVRGLYRGEWGTVIGTYSISDANGNQICACSLKLDSGEVLRNIYVCMVGTMRDPPKERKREQRDRPSDYEEIQIKAMCSSL